MYYIPDTVRMKSAKESILPVNVDNLKRFLCKVGVVVGLLTSAFFLFLKKKKKKILLSEKHELPTHVFAQVEPSGNTSSSKYEIILCSEPL